MTEFRRIQAEDVEVLREAAAKDDHFAIAPTHVVEKDGEIVGYASVGGLPLVHWWLDTQTGTAMDTARVMKQGEAELKAKGITHYQMLCGDNSPYLPFMDKMGYKFVGTSNLYVKEIK